ncbi:major facilitator superfamily protein [Caldisericum exile AZM16c01]|uniref:Major facilitator superfamily protein n=1 Tax=Caldisericum exile (strain DSM 21853 / NBRC 104410 / AZM16c01) TaxID=511051 RepID=A0A7U6JGT2_CALEA|nr:major facilitator superfamily protein [Caldisericum exile AZM16c01]
MNAISLNSGIFNLARIVGPAAAGISIAKLGYAFCFYANAASFIPVIVGLSLIRLPSRERNTKSIIKNLFSEIREGIVYAFKRNIILISLFLLLIVNILALNFNVLIPVFVKDVLKRSAETYRNMLSVMGIGAILGSTILAATSHKGVKDYYIFGGATLLGVSLILFSVQKSLIISFIFIMLSGFIMIIFLNFINTTIQINLEPYIRGRVMSLYAFVFGGLTPIGSLYAGTVSEKFGASFAFPLSGLLVLVVALVIYFSW